MIVFLVSGLWHGASFTFIIWGALHGAYQLIGTASKNIRKNIRNRINIHDDSMGYNIFRNVFVFGLVCFAWIFFRANTISDALFAVKKIARIRLADLYEFIFCEGIYTLGINNIEFIVVLVFIILVYLVDLWSQKHNVLKKISAEPLPFRWAVYLVIIFSIIVFGVYGNNLISEFIYFQF